MDVARYLRQSIGIVNETKPIRMEFGAAPPSVDMGAAPIPIRIGLDDFTNTLSQLFELKPQFMQRFLHNCHFYNSYIRCNPKLQLVVKEDISDDTSV